MSILDDGKTYTVELTRTDLCYALECIEFRMKAEALVPFAPTEKNDVRALERKLRPIDEAAMKEWLAAPRGVVRRHKSEQPNGDRA